jgi:carbamoyltransferase
MSPVDILGINAFHADAAAVLIRDGALLAGVEEERLNRIKHWAGFPAGSIRAVLADAGADLRGVAHVAVSRDPRAHVLDKALFAFRRRPSLAAVTDRLKNLRHVSDLPARLSSVGAGPFGGTVHNVEHHRAHAASAFYCSPFEEAACLTVDGFGDFLSSLSAVGRGSRLEVLDEVMFPHSLGILYTAVTQFLGFPAYGDEYKVMALASFGRPAFLEKMRKVVRLEEDGRFETDVDFFRHASEGVTMSWDDGAPVLGPLWSPRFEEEFGPARRPEADLTERDHDLAASLQAIYEEALFHRLRWLRKRTGLEAVCLAGGCALNSVANGKIKDRTDFKEVFVQPAAGDAGTALGAAQYVCHQVLGRPRTFVMEHAYFGPGFTEDRIAAALRDRLPGSGSETRNGARARRFTDEGVLASDTAAALARGEIVGWYQGRSEWGPRALGNRSILADPRRADMKDVLNARVKRREPFRPFAPSVLEERLFDWFEGPDRDPFMVKVYPVRAARRAQVPAVTHVDGTGRLQTVSREQNPRFWALLRAFEDATGVPILLNTSFNENEPIVNTPEEALDCFLRTRMDRLVLGDWVVERAAP